MSNYISSLALSLTISGNTGISPFLTLFLLCLIGLLYPSSLDMDTAIIGPILASWWAIIILGVLVLFETTGKMLTEYESIIDKAELFIVPIISIIASIATFGSFATVTTVGVMYDDESDGDATVTTYDNDGNNFTKVMLLLMGIVLSLLIRNFRMLMRESSFLCSAVCCTPCITILVVVCGVIFTILSPIFAIIACIVFLLAATYTIKIKFCTKTTIKADDENEYEKNETENDTSTEVVLTNSPEEKYKSLDHSVMFDSGEITLNDYINKPKKYTSAEDCSGSISSMSTTNVVAPIESIIITTVDGNLDQIEAGTHNMIYASSPTSKSMTKSQPPTTTSTTTTTTNTKEKKLLYPIFVTGATTASAPASKPMANSLPPTPTTTNTKEKISLSSFVVGGATTASLPSFDVGAATASYTSYVEQSVSDDDEQSYMEYTVTDDETRYDALPTSKPFSGFNPSNRIKDIFSTPTPSFLSRASPVPSSASGSVKELFMEQVSRLDELLALPILHIGKLGTTITQNEEEDDDLDAEMEDLESSRLALANELARIDFSILDDCSDEGSSAIIVGNNNSINDEVTVYYSDEGSSAIIAGNNNGINHEVYYTLKDLEQKRHGEIDMETWESYLNDEEFHKHFNGLTKDEFYLQPKWKRNRQKRNVRKAF